MFVCLHTNGFKRIAERERTYAHNTMTIKASPLDAYSSHREDEEMLVPHPEHNEGPQPIEVITAVNQTSASLNDPSSSRLTQKKDVAEHLRLSLKKEQEERERNRKREEKADADLYTIIKVARDQDLAKQIGKDILFDLVDHNKVRTFRIQKKTAFAVFKEEVAKEFGIPVVFLRFWSWVKRQNGTYRPNRPLSLVEESKPVSLLRMISNKTNNGEWKLFLEINLTPDLKPIPFPEKTDADTLLFLKVYDPEKEELRYVRSLFVKGLGKPSDILAKLKEMAGFAPTDEIELFEEIRFEPTVMCDRIERHATFHYNQLEDGDIICYQKVLSKEDEKKYRFPDVPSFLEYVHKRQIVHFRHLDKPKKDDFCLELSKVSTYDNVVERVARHISLDDPSKIRLAVHNCYCLQPKPQPIEYRGVDRLSDMLVHYKQTTDILYYEVLDIPLPELQRQKTLKVSDGEGAAKDEKRDQLVHERDLIQAERDSIAAQRDNLQAQLDALREQMALIIAERDVAVAARDGYRRGRRTRRGDR